METASFQNEYIKQIQNGSIAFQLNEVNFVLNKKILFVGNQNHNNISKLINQSNEIEVMLSYNVVF